MSIQQKQTADGPRFSVYLKHKGFPTYVGTYRSRKDARHAEEEEKVRRRQVQRGDIKPTDPKRTFKQASDAWLAQLERRKSRSYDGYESRMRVHLVPRFGKRKLGSLATEDVAELQAALETGSAPATVNGIVACLSSAFSYFCLKKWAAGNPCHAVDDVANDGKSYNWIRSKEEMVQLLGVLDGDLFDIVSTLLLTGMRLDEGLHLHWPDVNLERRLITVQRGRKGTTKSGKIRHVPILDSLLPVLRERRLQRDGKLLVFPGNQPAGTKAQSAVYVPFKRALGRASLDPRLRVHDLRHTFASHWMMDGGCIFKLSKVLGHSTVRVTEKYAHLAPDAFEDDYGRLAISLPSSASVADMAIQRQYENLTPP